MSDLIRRCDVLDNINKRIYYFDKASFDEAVKAVYNAPSVDATPRWISVEEQGEPTSDGEYLCYGYWFTSKRKWIEVAEYLGEWKIVNNFVLTHWMPLPEPPKEPEA